MNAIVTYLRNSRAELRRVTWPTRDEVVQATQATLIFVMLTLLFLLFTDTVFGNIIKTVL